jgi:hypothetical protein
MYEYGTLKPLEAILKRGRGKRENNGGDELNPDTLYTYMEISKWKPPVQLLCTNKTFKNLRTSRWK